MKFNLIFLVALLIFLGFVSCKKCPKKPISALGNPKSDKVVTCYYGLWSKSRQAVEARCSPKDLDAKLCTHLIAAFAGYDENTNTIKELDNGEAIFGEIMALKKDNPNLKILLALGGYNEGPRKFSALAADPVKLPQFVKSTTEYLKKFKFDGLDLDWEYPKEDDKDNFILLIKQFKDSFKSNGMLLTAALGAGKWVIDSGYKIKEMSQLLDYMHMMTYDFHGSWEDKIGINAGLYPQKSDKQNKLSVDDAVNYVKSLGADPKKIVIGLPFYGRSYDNVQSGVNQKTIDDMNAGYSGTFPGKYNIGPAMLGYNEICEKLQSESGWTSVIQKDTKTPVMYSGVQMVSYDDENSIAAKTQYAVDNGYAGVMIWSIDTDDCLGKCNISNRGKFPLLKTINEIMRKK